MLRVGDLTVDPATRAVRLAGEPVHLSAKEFALLQALAEEPERVCSKNELLRDVWGYVSIGQTRTVDAHACRLRKKLPTAGIRPGVDRERARGGLPAHRGAVTVIVLIAAGGWGLAAALTAARLRLSLARSSWWREAEHELRGSAATIALAARPCGASRAGSGGRWPSRPSSSACARGLADLDGARSGTRAAEPGTVVPIDRAAACQRGRLAARGAREGRPLRLRWEGPPRWCGPTGAGWPRRSRTCVANAVEHGAGRSSCTAGARVPGWSSRCASGRGRATGRTDRPGPRSRAAASPARAVEEAGGRLSLDRAAGGSTAAIELPVAEP